MDSNHESGAPTHSESPIEAEIKAKVDGMTDAQKDAYGSTLKLEAIDTLIELRVIEEQVKDKTDKSKLTDIKKKVVVNLEKIIIAAKKDIKINNNANTQTVIKKLADKTLFQDELIDIFKNFEEYLLGDKEITFASSVNEQRATDFEIEMIQMLQTNPAAAHSMIEVLVSSAQNFGKEPNELRKRFDMLVLSLKDNRSNAIVEEYFLNFPDKQKEFLAALHNPDEFLKVIKYKMEKQTSKIPHFKEEIRDEYIRQEGRQPTEEELSILVKRKIQIEVSEEIGQDISDILTLVYRQLGIERSNKDFNTISNEDFMKGITATKSVISRALNGLESHFRIMEYENPDKLRDFQMQKITEEDSYTAEINIDGNIRPQPRTKPLAYFKPVRMSEFITGQWTNFYHWQEATGYFHDISVVFNHPPHEGSFWTGVKGFAANMKMAFLDGFYNLPNGSLTIRAYHLLEKFKQEEYVKNDHKIVADMDTNQLEAVNTKIEQKVITYLRMEMEGEGAVSELRTTEAINNAVGIAKGIYLSETENLAYADAEGASQSYGTLDATPENLLNLLHTIARWGGPANLRPILFLPADGEKRSFWKSLFGIPQYDHNITYKNAVAFEKSFLDLKMGREGSMMNLVIDKILHMTKTADFVNRSGWRDYFAFSPHFTYDKDGNLELLDSFKSLDIIGYQPINWFLKNIDKGVDRSKKSYLEKTTGSEADKREKLFRYLHKQYFEQFSDQSYEDYIQGLKLRAKELVINHVKENRTMPFDDYDQAVQKQISDLFIQGTVSRVVAARFPTKLLRVDKDRFHKDVGSRWRQIYEKMKVKEGNVNMTRDEFSSIMNDLEFAEECVQSETSKKIKERIHILPLDEKKQRSLGNHTDLLHNLNRDEIYRILRSKKMDESRIERTIRLYDLIHEKLIGKSESRRDPNGKEIPGTKDLDFLDGEAVYAIEEFPFNIGQEHTDFSLIPYRATGPNTLVRAIGDMAEIDEVVIKGFMGLPVMFSEIAANGGDYSPLIQYLQKCQQAFINVHGSGNDYDFNYMVAGMFVNYMRKDDKAAPGRINSIAGLIAGDSNLVKEFDFKDIDRFYLAMQQKGLLLKENYDITKGPELENVWKIDKKTGEPVMTGSKKIKEIYKSSIKRLRERFGGDWKEGMANVLGKILPLVIIWLIYQYLKKAFEEIFGAKKG